MRRHQGIGPGGKGTAVAPPSARSRVWLVASLHRAGLANQAGSTHRGDGLKLHEVWFGSAVRCAPPKNRPTASERANCLPHLRTELEALPQLRVLLTPSSPGDARSTSSSTNDPYRSSPTAPVLPHSPAEAGAS
ncbi:MAG: uracil-DNA glycosylase family protein [Solirubrobacteraceae bacterium]